MKKEEKFAGVRLEMESKWRILYDDMRHVLKLKFFFMILCDNGGAHITAIHYRSLCY